MLPLQCYTVMDLCIFLLLTFELLYIRNKKKSQDPTHIIAEVQNCHWIWSTHHTEATGEKNQEKNKGGTQCTLVNEDHWY